MSIFEKVAVFSRAFFPSKFPWATFPRESLRKNGIFSFKIRDEKLHFDDFTVIGEDRCDFTR